MLVYQRHSGVQVIEYISSLFTDIFSLYLLQRKFWDILWQQDVHEHFNDFVFCPVKIMEANSNPSKLY